MKIRLETTGKTDIYTKFEVYLDDTAKGELQMTHEELVKFAHRLFNNFEINEISN